MSFAHAQLEDTRYDCEEITFAKRTPSVEVQIRRSVEVALDGGVASFITFAGLPSGKEHFVIAFPGWEHDTVPLVRIHSECITGDVFASCHCDCGPQLRESIQYFQAEGGILVYLRQEGRGIGLYNKLDAYALQAQGVDTFTANRVLGFPDDMRTYREAALMLRAIGKRKIRLLSNNPDKRRGLEQYGMRVQELVSTGVFKTRENHAYLEAKVRKSNHNIKLDGDK